jgi:hypothetical protein
VYFLKWPLKEARGILGIPFPWLVASEFMHYIYALIMVLGIWFLRKGFVGRSSRWWMVAFAIQSWHHFEHLLLQGQALFGQNFFNAPVPISVIQFLGFLQGTAQSGFNSMLTTPGVDQLTFLTIFVRRVEVHMIYNTLVLIPMIVAMYFHFFPSEAESLHMNCNCQWSAPRLQPELDPVS